MSALVDSAVVDLVEVEDKVTESAIVVVSDWVVFDSVVLE